MVYGAGESLIDIIFREGIAVGSTPGGSVLNSLVSAARLGVQASLVTDLGNDMASSIITTFLKGNGVGCDHIFHHSDDQTSIALAFLDDAGDAQYQFYKASRVPSFSVSFTPDDVLLIASFYAVSDRTSSEVRGLVQNALTASSFVFYDPNYRPAQTGNQNEIIERIISLMRLASVVRLSEEDALHIFGVKSCEDIIACVPELANKPLIVTRAERGVELMCNNEHRRFDSKCIVPVSTIGAGDTFNAAIVAAISHVPAQDRSQLGVEFFSNLIECAVELSSSVCLSIDNYVACEDYSRFWQRIAL
ncbi:MAG: PfkB family carbohydrate kinase [Spirochaetes bacterium]|jgi:fructokinase|nr:PfkB family carbohydrate kinase [Spirochaetota bacterium]